MYGLGVKNQKPNIEFVHPKTGKEENTMWKYFGTFVNVIAVILGSLIGLVLKNRKPSAEKKAKRDPLSDTMMVCLGFCTIFAAASGLPLEQVLSDALFKLAGELSLEALKSEEGIL